MKNFNTEENENSTKVKEEKKRIRIGTRRNLIYK